MNDEEEADNDAAVPEAELPDACTPLLPEDPLNDSLTEAGNVSGMSNSHKFRQSSVPDDGLESNRSENDIFGCVLLAYKCQFKGQSPGSFIARWEISSHSAKSFIHKIWNLAKQHLNREVIFSHSVQKKTEQPAQCGAKAERATTQAVIELADDLRSTHGNHLDEHGMAWSFWANSILNGPAHL